MNYYHDNPELCQCAGNERLLRARGRPALDNSGEWQVTYTTITTTATDASGEVHDRMPIFLTEDAWADWLRPGKLHPLEQEAPRVAATLQPYPVSRRGNNVRTTRPDDANLIERDSDIA